MRDLSATCASLTDNPFRVGDPRLDHGCPTELKRVTHGLDIRAAHSRSMTSYADPQNITVDNLRMAHE